MTRDRNVLLALALCGAAATAEAGPWATGRGHSYVKLGYGRLVSTTLANPDGSQVAIPRFVKDDVVVFAAVGLDERVTLLADVPLVRRSDLEFFTSEAAVGDVAFGAQLQLGTRGRGVFAGRLMVQAPTGDETLAGGVLSTGSGVWEGEVVFTAGSTSPAGRVYYFAELGYRYRDVLRDGFTYGAQVGWNATPRLVLAWNVRGLEPWSDTPREVALGNPVGLGDGVASLAFGPTAIVKLGAGLAVQFDVEGTARERNLAVGTTWRMGVSWSR